MSAWLCSPIHLRCLVTLAIEGPKVPKDAQKWYPVRWRGSEMNHERADELLQALLRANLESLAARYDDREGANADVWDEPAPLMSDGPAPRLQPGEAAKLVHCFEYQSNEVDGWERTEMATLCHDLYYALLCYLPGYEAAPWGFESEHVTK